MKRFLIFFLVLGCLACKQNSEPLETETINVELYKGKWYEIARLPNNFQKNLECVTATYTMKSNGNIEVVNQGYNTKKNKVVKAKGEAKPAEEDFSTGKLKVTFFKPIWGDYYVIDRGDDYEYALVGNPSREFLWILARGTTLPDQTIDELLDLATSKGFDVSPMHFTKHDCNSQVATIP